jgi:hypothetical protein
MVYFIRDEATQFIKIGFTAGDGEDRLRDLQTGCPGRMVLLIQREGSKQEEAALHKRFADARVRSDGEWFRPVPELLLAIMEEKVSQLEAQNAQLRARLQADRKRVWEARGSLGQVWALMRGEPMLECDLVLPGGPVLRPPTKVSRLEAENAELQAKLEAERNHREYFLTAIKVICDMLEEPAGLPVR